MKYDVAAQQSVTKCENWDVITSKAANVHKKKTGLFCIIIQKKNRKDRITVLCLDEKLTFLNEIFSGRRS